MRRRVAAVLALTAVVLLAAAVPAGARARDPQARSVATAARWIGDQQDPDGGFPGGEVATPEAILALAESAQTSDEWSGREGFERVEEQVGADGDTPIDAARRLARRTDDPGVVARLLLMVAQPLGTETGADGPFGDLVERVARLAADPGTDFDDHVLLTAALLSVGVTPPEGGVERILAAQQPDGGWNATGDPEAATVDLATTGWAVETLVQAGNDPATGPVAAALSFVGSTRLPRGAWPDEAGDRSAVATAGAVLALRAAGYDPATTCWPGSGSTAPLESLRDLQAEDGSFGDVPATAAAVHALSGTWLPRVVGGDPCAPAESGFPVDPTLVVLVLIAAVGVGGGIRIMRSEGLVV